MQQLSALDAQFLHLESPTTTGHVGALVVLEAVGSPADQLRLEDLRDLLEQRLHLVRPLRQRLLEVPLGLGLPYWVDDPDFDLEFHLREIRLASPASDEQLAEQLALVHARPLDRNRPLWEMYLVHGVGEGRQALYTKVHHAAIDGLTGAEILSVLMDSTPEPPLVEPPTHPWHPPALPGRAEMLQRGLASLLLQPGEILRTLPQTLPHLMDIPGAANVPGAQMISELADAALRRATGSGREEESRPLVAPRTPLNGAITAHRRFSFGSVPLADVKRVKDAYGLTVNDVVLALCTTTLRRWLLDHDALPAIPIVVAVPVSTRPSPPDPDGGHGNQISVMWAQLPTHEADPLKRLVLVQQSMIEAKQHYEAVPASMLADLSAVIPTALSGLAARALFRLVTAPGPPFNLYVSNVPGPQLPLYIAGARVEGVFPLSPVTHLTGGLTVTAFSYDGALDFGLIACRELVPDVWNLVGYLGEALTELLELSAAPAG